MREVIAHLADVSLEYHHPYLEEREPQKVAYIVVSSDRGLCGGLNVNLFRHLIADAKEWHDKGVGVQYGVVGSKAAGFFKSVGGEVTSTVTGLGDVPRMSDLIGVIRAMTDDFVAAKVDRVYLVFNEFVNTMTQSPSINQLLPLPQGEASEFTTNPEHNWDYLYEPSAAELG